MRQLTPISPCQLAPYEVQRQFSPCSLCAADSVTSEPADSVPADFGSSHMLVSLPQGYSTDAASVEALRDGGPMNVVVDAKQMYRIWRLRPRGDAHSQRDYLCRLSCAHAS